MEQNIGNYSDTLMAEYLDAQVLNMTAIILISGACAWGPLKELLCVPFRLCCGKNQGPQETVKANEQKLLTSGGHEDNSEPNGAFTEIQDSRPNRDNRKCFTKQNCNRSMRVGLWSLTSAIAAVQFAHNLGMNKN